MRPIPQAVIKAAEKVGYNIVEYIGEYDGAQVYQLGKKEMNSTPIPTGLPSAIVFKKNTVQLVHGVDCLDLLSRFE